MGRPSYKPTDKNRDLVKMLAGLGIKEADIARVLEISEPTLRKHFRRELDIGITMAVANVGQSLYLNATKKMNVTAQIFFLKTKGGWRETAQVVELPEGSKVVGAGVVVLPAERED